MSQSGGYHLNQSGGYDYKFMVEPSEDFICTLCHLVLKNPLQLEDCGHIFCKCCYENMKCHTEANFLELLCPLDRLKIHPAHVFKDKATERKILNLKVQCPNFGDCCTWTGELRNIQHHEESCPKNQAKEYTLFGIELKQLVNRMTELELKVKTNEQNLEEKDKQITKQCKTIENLNKEVKELAKQITNQNKIIDNENKQFKNLTKQQVDNQTKKIDNLIKKQIEDQDQDNSQKLQIKQINEQIENQTLQIKSLQHQTNIIMPSSKDSEDSNGFSAVCAAFEWRFNMDFADQSSIPFYNHKNSHGFELYIYTEEEDLCICLSRCRGKYDLDSDKAITKTDKFVFNIHLRGNNGYKIELEYKNATDDDDEFGFYAIFEDQEYSEGCHKRIFKDEIDMLTVRGYVNIHCFFK